MPIAVNEVVYNTSISLNRVFVIEFVNWVRFGASRKDPAQKGVCRILGFSRNRTVPKSNHNKGLWSPPMLWMFVVLVK